MTERFLDRFKTKPRAASNVVQLKRSQPNSEENQDWVQLPKKWVEALWRSKSAYTIKLAHLILLAEYSQRRSHKKIKLTKETTGMSRSPRHRAVKELVKLGLIETEKVGEGRSIRVTQVNHLIENKKKR
jgi:hypothetical protein